MEVAVCIALIMGGIAVFMLGLKLVGGYSEKLAGVKIKMALSKVTGNRYIACGLGMATTSVAQSSVAINIAVIGFVNAGVLTLFDACSVIIGTNIGTTITAQLVSLSAATSFNVTAIGSVVAFVGLIMTFLDKELLQNLGNFMLGFGLIFIGIEIMTTSINPLKEYEQFRAIFSIENNAILLLNGFVLTAICQSSSVVSSMLVILAPEVGISFEGAMYIIMGANIGTCLAVIFASDKKGLLSRRTAWFNLLFNIAGSIVFCIVLLLFSNQITTLFALSGSSISRQIANFHTFFNLIVALLVLPFLKPFIKLVELLIKDKKNKEKKKTKLVISG